MSLLSKDIEIAHRRRWPGRSMGLVSCLWLLVKSPGLRLLLVHRLDRWAYLKRKGRDWCAWLCRIMNISFVVPLKVVIKISSKGVLYRDIEIEEGVCFSDHGYIIFGALKTGTGTIIGTRVTVGIRHADRGRPTIGRNVWIGSDCVIYGNINIGNGATLLPGTVLTRSIPANVVIEGNPAQLVLRNFDNSELRKYQNINVMHCVNAKRKEGG